MSGLTFTLNAGHGYAMLIGVSSIFVTLWAGFKVGGARKKYGIAYPTMYAPEGHKNEKEFNCVQRAHQNVLENYPQFLLLLALGSIKRPHIAAALGAVRVAGFIVYCAGYQTGSPDKRLRGAFGYIGLLGLLVLTLEVVKDLLA